MRYIVGGIILVTLQLFSESIMHMLSSRESDKTEPIASSCNLCSTMLDSSTIIDLSTSDCVGAEAESKNKTKLQLMSSYFIIPNRIYYT